MSNKEEAQSVVSESEITEEVQEDIVPTMPISEENVIQESVNPPVPDTPELARMIGESLTERVKPIIESIRELKASTETITAEMRQSSKLYALMTENRNRAMLLLTKYTEMYEMLKALAEFCKDNIGEAGACSDFERQLLTRTGNFERIMLRTLSSFGIAPIWPQKKDVFDAAVHQCIATIEPGTPEDVPGTISACSKMGILQDGVVLRAAEVIVFNTLSEQTDESIG